jgi:hypothetical protein
MRQAYICIGPDSSVIRPTPTKKMIDSVRINVIGLMGERETTDSTHKLSFGKHTAKDYKKID